MTDRPVATLTPARGTPALLGTPFRLPLRPEGELLLHCARARLSRETAARVAELARAPLDWDLVFRLAIRHGTIPRLHLHLAAACPGVAPPEVTARIRAQYGYNSVRNLTHARELIRLLGALEAACRGLWECREPERGPWRPDQPLPARSSSTSRASSLSRVSCRARASRRTGTRLTSSAQSRKCAGFAP